MGEMVYGYKVVISESPRRMLQAFPRASRSDRTKETSLFPPNDGADVWKFPTALQMKSSVDLWKSRAPPRIGSRVVETLRTSQYRLNLAVKEKMGRLKWLFSPNKQPGAREIISKACAQMGRDLLRNIEDYPPLLTLC